MEHLGHVIYWHTIARGLLLGIGGNLAVVALITLLYWTFFGVRTLLDRRRRTFHKAGPLKARTFIQL